MAQYVKTRVRVPLYPSKVGENFINLFAGSTPKIHMGAGADFEIAIFNSADELFDVSNITDISVLVRPTNSNTTEILKTVDSAAINSALSLESWRSGVQAHVTIPLLGTETAIAAGTHRITIWGHTNDAAVDPDVFGTSVLEVLDSGITAVTNPAVTPNYLTAAQTQALLGSYVPYVMPAGKTLTFMSRDGLFKRILGVQTNDGAASRQDDLEDAV
jgi:hypothetical protein